MLRQALRILVVLVLVAGTLLPKVGAVLVPFLPGVITAVICTGTQRVVLTLDDMGNPIEVPEPMVDECVAEVLPDTKIALEPAWYILARSYADPFVALPHSGAASHWVALQPPAQAPPAVI